MSRIVAPPLRRTLAAFVATCFLSGCGQVTVDQRSLADQRRSSLHPQSLDNRTAKPPAAIEQGRVILASFPVAPLPLVNESVPALAGTLDQSNSLAAWPLGGAAVAAPPVDAPIVPPAVQVPAMPQFPSAYAVAPRRSVNPDDRLAPLSGPSDPTPQLVAVARQADIHIGRGLRLAERGALFTARAELTQALRLSAAALDEQRQTNAYTRALSNGLRALGEAEEFLAVVRTADYSQQTIDAIVQGHRTPVLVDEASDNVNPGRAIELYFTYAQEQLAAAGGDLQPAASALYALGKLDMSAASEIGSLESVRAAVFLQAALIVNPRHALAANELGVLLARRGQLLEAKAALVHTVQITSLPAAWRNLSIVHESLGEQDLAGRADWQWRQAASAQPEQSPQAPGAPAVRWVDPNTFVQTTRTGSDASASAPR